MTKILTLTLAIAFALAIPFLVRAQATGQSKPLTPEQELKALDLSWHQAVAAHDAEALGRLLAEDYRFHLDAARMLTKAQEVEVKDLNYRGKVVTSIRVSVNGELLYELLDHDQFEHG